jgi:hypothetical protein
MANTRLEITPESSFSETWTWSGWVKRTGLGASGLFNNQRTDNNINSRFKLFFNSSNELQWEIKDSGGTDDSSFRTNRVFRDTSAWYHIVFIYDTTNGTAGDRLRLYINGERVTSFAAEDQAGSNFGSLWSSSVKHYVGVSNDNDGLANYFNGLMAHVHLTWGTVYEPSTFGETDATTGIWKPKTAPSVTYGAEGYFLKFENSASFGTDSSPNANNFTVNGTMTQTIDTPSNVFATFNPLNVPTSNAPTFSEGNLQVTTTNLSHVGGFSTIGITTGKWYAEFKIISTSSENATIGITGQSAENARNNKFAGQETTSYGYSYTAWGSLYDGSGTGSWGSTYGAGDIIGVAVDLDSNNLYFYKNGVVQNGGTAVSITASSSTSEGVYCFGTGDGSIGNNNTVSANFGNGYFGTTPVSSAENPDDGIGIFEYDVPTGYKALCTKSINAQEYN